MCACLRHTVARPCQEGGGEYSDRMRLVFEAVAPRDDRNGQIHALELFLTVAGMCLYDALLTE